MTVRLNGVTASTVAYTQLTEAAPFGRYRWVDLGEYSHLRGASAFGASVDDVWFRISTTRASTGTTANGLIDISALLLVPLGEGSRTLVSDLGGANFDWKPTVFDAALEANWSQVSPGLSVSAGRSIYGGWPEAHPGSSTDLVLLRQVNNETPLTELESNPHHPTDVTVSGHPQWLYLPSEGV